MLFDLFYRTKLRRANVSFLSAPVKDGTTGTVIVLTTADAQRTMLAYQVTSYLHTRVLYAMSFNFNMLSLCGLFLIGLLVFLVLQSQSKQIFF